MAVNLAVVHAPGVVPHRVVPVRFARAVSGFSDTDAPDLDDHGFTVPAQFGTARGPVTGVIQGSTIRVKIIRDLLDSKAALFVTSDDKTIASIEFPGDAALKSTDIAATAHAPARFADCVYIKGESTAATEKDVKIFVRFGSKTGPILAEMCARVYPLIIIPVQIHNVSINGTAAGVTLAQGTEVFKKVNKIYAQAGIRFDVLPALKSPPLTGFSRAGAVTLSAVNDTQNVELQTILNTAPTANALNAYFIPGYFDNTNNQLNGTLGIAFSRANATANPATAVPAFPGCQAGITVFNGPDPLKVAHTAAHEIGHSLTLEHYNLGNGATEVHTHWSHRCLMQNFVQLNASDLPVGYGTFTNGNKSVGELLMTKQRPGIQQSLEIDIMRKAANAKSCFPLP